MPEEIPFAFECDGEHLYGILHNVHAASGYGVLIVVGGPQTRVGSHRQFVLLARSLAANRIPVMRFDYRGIGDATGSPRSFQDIDRDIRRAIDAMIEWQPTIDKVIIWGLCDAASAAMFYAFQDSRVKGLVLLNPDTLTVTSEAQAYLKHYYVRKIFDCEVWRKILYGRFEYRDSMLSFTRTIANLFGSRQTAISGESSVPFPERMRKSLARFGYPILLILSGRDLTADAFQDLVSRSSGWQRILSEQNRVTHHTLEQADHTFSTRQWRDQVAALTLDWIAKLP
ncbi:MAG: hydrolase 1, exosortase A system-associated [Methylococcaceae bacterium]|nr:hydrolase 1, exosortase A system-associated [Methylococcaceae bacterium]MCI0734079.1 hydrolase 1, exosortase A system-associated [Methylococcaceae bacterium]